MTTAAVLSRKDTVQVQPIANSSTSAAVMLVGSFAETILVNLPKSDVSGRRLLDVLTRTLTNRVADPPEEVQADWKITVDNQIESLAALPVNWDSYNAPQISAAVIADAKVLASRLATPSSPAPSVVPTVNGTIQLEWHTRSGDGEIEILEPDRYYVFAKRVDAPAWEGETTLNEAVYRLEKLLFNR